MRQIDADELTEKVWRYGLGTREDIANLINNAPTVDPIKHGHWKYDNQYHWYRACCSECGYYRVTDIKADRWNEWKYCPNCGAKMNERGDAQ